MMTPSDRLSAYLSRIGLAAAPPVSGEGLIALQAAHRSRIPFENLDVMLGRPILIDSASAFDKLVTQRRGGYCFEQNRLFADMLEEMGFPVRPLLARVLLGAPPESVTPRTHVLLHLEVDGAPWIADAGFGGSFTPPMPLLDQATAQTKDGARHRLRKIGRPGDLSGEWVLERAGPGGEWLAQYCFDLSPVAPIDLEQCNHWTSTRAETRCTSFHILSIALPDGFVAMTDQSLTITRGEHREEKVIGSAQDYRATLATLFGIALSAQEVAALPVFAGT